MSLVRCASCGEIEESSQGSCRGCGQSLATAQAVEGPQLTAAQREARRDVGTTKFMLVGLGVMILVPGTMVLTAMGCPAFVSYPLGLVAVITTVILVTHKEATLAARGQVTGTVGASVAIG